MITSSTDPAAQAFARKWTDMTPVGRYVSFSDSQFLTVSTHPGIHEFLFYADCRFAEAKEIGDLAVLLCSERNSPWMTGSDVVIDGGECCRGSRAIAPC